MPAHFVSRISLAASIVLGVGALCFTGASQVDAAPTPKAPTVERKPGPGPATVKKQSPADLVKNPEVKIVEPAIELGLRTPSLFWNSGTTLVVDGHEAADREFRITASQASVLPSSSDPHLFTLVPTGKTVSAALETTDNGRKLRREFEFTVVTPPRPEIQVLVNGTVYNGMSPISKKSSVVVRLRPDSDFLASHPKDARYMISEVELLAQRSLGVPTTLGTYSGNGKDAAKGVPIALGNKLEGDASGTKIYFKIGKIYRINFQNKKFEVAYSDRELALGAVIK